MKVVIALGGNALLERGESSTAENQMKNAETAAVSMAEIAKKHDLIIAHGNGPQVGLLALQGDAYSEKVPPYPLDVLVAQTQGMIGYFMQQPLQKLMPGKEIVTLVTQVSVDENDPSFKNPTKPIGPVYNSQEEAEELAKEKGWTVMPDGKYFRRAVPSPMPKEIVEINSINAIINSGGIPITVGGGGIPVVKQADGTYKGVEAVIDKDRASALLAAQTGADAFIILTDVDGVYLDWGTPNQRRLEKATIAEIREHGFAAGSMGPKVEAICEFVEKTGKFGAIGNLKDGLEILNHTKGTIIVP